MLYLTYDIIFSLLIIKKQYHISMRKIFLLFFLFVYNCCAFTASASDIGENSDVFNKGLDGQKQISNTKFKKTIDLLKERALTSKQKRMRKQIQPHSPAYDSEYLKNFTDSQTSDDDLSRTLTVMIPVRAYNDEGKYIQPGYYKLSCRKIGQDNYLLDLSQGNNRVISVEAKQTKQDLEQDTIQFCNAKVLPNGRIRLMYGSIDLNLAGYIYYDLN